MASLDSVLPYPCDFGSTRAATATARTQQRIRKDERTWTSDTYAPYDDGHQWRKYGEKKLSNSNFPRFYYRCTYKNDMKCRATKQVQQKDASDPPMFSVTYFNHHTCSSSSSTPLGSTRDMASRSSSKKAMSICFSTQTSSESPSLFLTPVATTTPRPPAAMHSYRSSSAYQQPEGSSTCYAHHPFRWTGVPSPTTSNNNGPAKIETGEFADQAIGHSSSSSASGSAPSRTLLPIGQSRCIEYFHFL